MVAPSTGSPVGRVSNAFIVSAFEECADGMQASAVAGIGGWARCAAISNSPPVSTWITQFGDVLPFRVFDSVDLRQLRWNF